MSQRIRGQEIRRDPALPPELTMRERYNLAFLYDPLRDEEMPPLDALAAMVKDYRDIFLAWNAALGYLAELGKADSISTLQNLQAKARELGARHIG